MDRDLAKHVVTVSIKTASRLGDLVPLLREHMPPQEYEVHAKAIARAVYAIGHEVTEQIFAEHPDLHYELDYLIDAVYGGGSRIMLIFRGRPETSVGRALHPFMTPLMGITLRDELERDLTDLASAVTAHVS